VQEAELPENVADPGENGKCGEKAVPERKLEPLGVRELLFFDRVFDLLFQEAVL